MIAWLKTLTWIKIVSTIILALFIWRIYVSAIDFLWLVGLGGAWALLWWYQNDWKSGLYRVFRIMRWTVLLPFRMIRNWLDKKGVFDGIKWPVPEWMWPRRTTTQPQKSPTIIVVRKFPSLADQITFVVNLPVCIVLMLLALSPFI